MTESVLELSCVGWLRRTSHVALVIEDIACSWLETHSQLPTRGWGHVARRKVNMYVVQLIPTWDTRMSVELYSSYRAILGHCSVYPTYVKRHLSPWFL